MLTSSKEHFAGLYHSVKTKKRVLILIWLMQTSIRISQSVGRTVTSHLGQDMNEIDRCPCNGFSRLKHLVVAVERCSVCESECVQSNNRDRKGMLGCFLGGFYFVYFNIPFLRPQYIRTWLMFMMVRAYILLLYIVFLYSFEYVIVNDC